MSYTYPAFTRLDEAQDVALRYLCEVEGKDRSVFIRETLEECLKLRILAPKARSFFARHDRLIDQERENLDGNHTEEPS